MLGIVIQARLGSKRLPNKMLLPFYESKGVLELVIENLLENFNNPIIQQYENVINTNGIEIAGIEFITSELGEIYTYDINTNTNYNSEAEKLSNIKGMKSIAEFLTQELKLVTQYTNLLRKVS